MGRVVRLELLELLLLGERGLRECLIRGGLLGELPVELLVEFVNPERPPQALPVGMGGHGELYPPMSCGITVTVASGLSVRASSGARR